jgi:hypothetical protein
MRRVRDGERSRAASNARRPSCDRKQERHQQRLAQGSPSGSPLFYGCSCSCPCCPSLAPPKKVPRLCELKRDALRNKTARRSVMLRRTRGGARPAAVDIVGAGGGLPPPPPPPCRCPRQSRSRPLSCSHTRLPTGRPPARTSPCTHSATSPPGAGTTRAVWCGELMPAVHSARHRAVTSSLQSSGGCSRLRVASALRTAQRRTFSAARFSTSPPRGLKVPGEADIHASTLLNGCGHGRKTVVTTKRTGVLANVGVRVMEQ